MSSVDSEDDLLVVHSSPLSLPLLRNLRSTSVLSTKSSSFSVYSKLTLSASVVLSPLADERGGKGRAANADRWLLLPLCVVVRVGHQRH